MKEILLTQGQVALVDDDDFERVNAFKWKARWNRLTQSYYAVRISGGKKAQKTIYMARFVMDTPTGMICDHINHNTLDNQKRNLRNCTRAQNAWNKGPNKNNKTGFKGICKYRDGYSVTLQANKKIFNKWFHTLEEAIAHRDKIIEELHGEYACTESKRPA